MTGRKHPRDMTRDELIQFADDMTWAALDLAQHLSCTNDLLREEHRPDAYKRAEQMAYAIVNGTPEPTSGIQLIDHRGLTNVRVADTEEGSA